MKNPLDVLQWLELHPAPRLLQILLAMYAANQHGQRITYRGIESLMPRASHDSIRLGMAQLRRLGLVDDGDSRGGQGIRATFGLTPAALSLLT